MRIYWYWPFARPEELPLACATVRPGDEITVQVIYREEAPTASPCKQVRLLGNLPDVRRGFSRSPAWLASRALTYGGRAWRRERAVSTLKPDICHLQYLNRFTDWRLPRSQGGPLVMNVHDVLPHSLRLPLRAERTLLEATYRRADALIVHHDRLRHRLLADFDLDESRVHVLAHQVFAYENVEPQPLPERPRVLLFGALRANKGIDVFLDALPSIPPEITVCVAGRGEAAIEDRLLRAAAADSRLRVEIGHVPSARKVQLFHQASVVVLPYTSFASQSGVLHDAYALGRPVIVTDVGALGETVRQDGTGLIVPPGDAPALATAIEGLVSGPALAHHADRALAIQRERSPSVLGVRLREIYDRIS